VVGANDHSVFGYFLRLRLNHLMPPVAPCPDTVMALVAVDDVARGLVAAVLRGRIGDTYFFSGQRHTLRALFQTWQREIPGGMAVRWWVPQWTGWLMLAPVGPLLRFAGLSAFLSGETARQAGSSLDYSSAKATRELQWTPQPARDMWRAIGQAEFELMMQRRGQPLALRLRPLADAL
jgi:nucleoside-diphosphate-sugar epimerase